MSDVDDTGATLQALAAAGRRGGGPVRDGVAYLRATQAADGGWGQLEGRDSNAQSTSWAVQGMVAARASLSSLGADPLRYLRGLQRRDGHFSYSRTSDQTPVWVTAQALAAIQRKALPIAPARRGERAVAAAAGSAGDGAPPTDGGPAPAVVVGALALLVALVVAAVGWLRRDGTPAQL
jgi:hypothetical protein